MKIRRERVVLTIILLGIIMTAFTSTLTTMSYRKLQAETRVHAGVINTTSTIKKLNYALSFGKPLNKFYGLKDLMSGMLRLDGDILGAEIADDESVTVETLGDISETVRRETPDEEYDIEGDGIYAFVHFDGGEIILRLNRKPLDDSVKEYIRFVLRIDAFVLLGIVFVAMVVCIIPGKKEISIKMMRIAIIIILVGSQLILGFIAMGKVDSEMLDSFDHIALITARSVENDINEVVNKGIYYDEIEGLDEYLKNLADAIPELSDIRISEKANAGEGYAVNRIGIRGTGEEVFTECFYSQELIKSKRINNSIDVLILILITIFISMEAVNFLTKHLEFRDTRSKDELYIPGFRLFIFVEGIAFALDSGFFSVYSNTMFAAMELPDSMSFLGGMPNTMYSIAVLIGLFGCGSLINRFGMKKTLVAGILAGVIGYLLCAVSPNLPALIAARFIFGFCDGIIINAVRLFAAGQENKEMHNRLLVEYMAAINLGVSCGVVIGGLLADAASYVTVFIVGAFIGIFCLFLIFIAGFPEKNEKEEKFLFIDAVRELRYPQVIIFMVFVVIPLYMASLFVEYTFPLFGDEMNFSNSLVSGLLMMNFMIIAYLTDPISDWVIKRIRTRQAMLAYMALQTLSIGIFVLTSSIWAAVLALIFTSIWDCFGMVVIDSALDNVEGTATERSTLLQMVFGKLAMVIGPVAITSRLSGGAAKATGVIIVFLVIGIIVYAISILYFSGGVKKENRGAG